MSDYKRTPADTYDELFVPALFQQWPPIVLDAARVAPSNTILGVACNRRTDKLRKEPLAGHFRSGHDNCRKELNRRPVKSGILRILFRMRRYATFGAQIGNISLTSAGSVGSGKSA